MVATIFSLFVHAQKWSLVKRNDIIPQYTKGFLLTCQLENNELGLHFNLGKGPDCISFKAAWFTLFNDHTPLP